MPRKNKFSRLWEPAGTKPLHGRASKGEFVATVLAKTAQRVKPKTPPT